jgi:phage terminase small subunit
MDTASTKTVSRRDATKIIGVSPDTLKKWSIEGRGPHGLIVRPAAQHAVKLRASLTTLGKSLGLDPASAARFASLQPPASEPDELDEYIALRRS